ncbi:MAG: hypothetical protein ACRBFS_06600 [Aureispira sp.]
MVREHSFEPGENTDATKIGLVQTVNATLFGNKTTIDPNAASKMTASGERIDRLSNKARLIAHEILLKKEFIYLRAEDVDINVVAKIYTTALAQNTTGMSNSWGLLYEHDDMGPVGYFFGHLGEDGLSALLPLLDNPTIHLYHGSEAATVGNSYQFQVRDFAAYYISQILNEPSPYQAKRTARDQEIERLRILVQNR